MSYPRRMFGLGGRSVNKAPTPEEIRKRARLLVVDDETFPPERLFKRDGYHIERWSSIKSVAQLTDNHFDLIMLDLHGVGLTESPDRQGLGILEHIRKTNPTQLVIAYSAIPWNVSNKGFFSLADEVFDKGEDYLTYKSAVDQLLARRYSPGFFIARMNIELGDHAAEAPLAVPKALQAIRKGSTKKLQTYLEKVIQNKEVIGRTITVINVGINAIRVVHGL